MVYWYYGTVSKGNISWGIRFQHPIGYLFSPSVQHFSFQLVASFHSFEKLVVFSFEYQIIVSGKLFLSIQDGLSAKTFHCLKIVICAAECDILDFYFDIFLYLLFVWEADGYFFCPYLEDFYAISQWEW